MKNIEVIDNGLSDKKLSDFETMSIVGGEACYIQACGLDACGIDKCVIDVCPIDACAIDLFVTDDNKNSGY